jgi:hypothetical protein
MSAHPLLFVDTFEHAMGGAPTTRVDEILLLQPSVVRELYIVDPQTALPLPGQAPFQG